MYGRFYFVGVSKPPSTQLCDFGIGGRANPQNPLPKCTMIIVHACTMIIVRACTLLIVQACTIIIIHAGTNQGRDPPSNGAGIRAMKAGELAPLIPGEPVPLTDPIRFLNPNCKNPSSAPWLGKNVSLSVLILLREVLLFSMMIGFWSN